MNSVINKKPKALTNVCAAFACGLVPYTFIVQLHLYKWNKKHPQKLYPNKKYFLWIDVFKTSKPLLSRGLLVFSWVFLLLVTEFCISRMLHDRIWSQDNFKEGSILNYLTDSVANTLTNIVTWKTSDDRSLFLSFQATTQY